MFKPKKKKAVEEEATKVEEVEEQVPEEEIEDEYEEDSEEPNEVVKKESNKEAEKSVQPQLTADEVISALEYNLQRANSLLQLLK